MNIGERAWQLLLELTACESITQTAGERAVAHHVHSVLAANPYFQHHPEQLQLLPLPAENQPAVVAALVRGRGNRTIILLSHHDVVGVDDYGVYKHLAFRAEELTEALRENPGILPEAAQADLLSGEWLFGRGTMDMLYGLAIQMAFMEKMAADPEQLAGNLLLLTVPDEENNSLGMRHAVELVRQMQVQYGLEFTAALNSESHGIVGEGHVVQTGTDGKLMPLIYCFGKETHAGTIYSGLNAHLLLAEVTRRLELNPDFFDSVAGEVSFPPTLLLGGDMKQFYNVSTPTAAWGFFNVFTLAASPKVMMQKLQALCEEAMVAALERHRQSVSAWEKAAGKELPAVEWQPQVWTYAQLWEQAFAAHGDELVRNIENLTQRLQASGTDLQRLTLELIHETHRHCPNREPKIVIAIAPPYYPHIRNRRGTDKELHVMQAVGDLQRYASELGVELKHEEFYLGISDSSYVMLQDAGEVVGIIKDNCPAWGRAYHLPLDAVSLIDAPTVNLGAFGRDIHKFTERIHVPFAKEVLPRLLERLIANLLPEA
ncbi:MAG: M20/M25/M40 family metallo-hydrolase [Bacillota bacterium]